MFWLPCYQGNGNKNQNEVPPNSTEIWKFINNTCRHACGEKGILCHLVGVQASVVTVEVSVNSVKTTENYSIE